MKTNPKSEQEIEKSERERLEQFLIPNKSECDFEVTKAEAKKSKAGNDMIHITLKVYHGDNWKLIDDYLLASIEAKLRHFCEAVGLLPQYESDSLAAEDCVGRSGKVLIKIKAATGEYPAKNEVRDYVKPEEKKVPSPADKRPEDDEIPF